MNVTGNDLKYFVNVLSALSKYCLDAQIYEGKIRIRSNNRVGLYDIDLPDVWNVSVNIPILKSFIDLVKLFIPGDDETVVLDIQDEGTLKKLHIEDDMSEIDISLGEVQNRFVTDQELKNIGFFDKKYIGSFTLSGKAIDKLKALQKNFSVSVVTINTLKKKLQIESESKTRFASFNLDSSIENTDECPDMFKFSFLALDFPFQEEIPLDIQLFKLPNNVYMVGVKQDNVNIYSSAIKQ